MEPKERIVRIFVERNGRVPFEIWMNTLRDKSTKARILTRIDRLRLGNFGDCKPVGDGVYELRIHFGPGFRNITAAKRYWQEVNQHEHDDQ